MPMPTLNHIHRMSGSSTRDVDVSGRVALLPQTAWVTVDVGLQKDKMTCRYSTDRTQENETVPVEDRNGRAIRLTVPPAGFVIYG